jgi:hypothetical protein
MSKIKFDELNEDGKLILFAMLQAALKMRELGKTQDYFIKFSKEVWDTMEMNDEDKLRNSLMNAMRSDLLKLKAGWTNK